MTIPPSARPLRVALVGSSGGHLAHLLALKPWWEQTDRMWVTFRKPDAEAVLSGEEVVWCHHPTNRNVPNLVRNTLLAARVLWRWRPMVVVSSGAGVAIPFFYLAKLLLGARTVYIEVVDRVDRPTLTGRLVRPVTDVYAVQWPEQIGLYPRTELIGRLV